MRLTSIKGGTIYGKPSTDSLPLTIGQMRVLRSCRWFTALALFSCLSLAGGSTSNVLRAQSGTGVLQVSVLSEPSGEPLPYAVVTIAARQLERFTDARGRLLVPLLPAGVYDVTIRRLGFVPSAQRVEIIAGATATLDVRLVQVPQQLRGMVVSGARPCSNPGVPDKAREPEIFALVALLRENADRYRLLASQYPFGAVHIRALGEVYDSTMILRTVDSSAAMSGTKPNYRPGRVVRRERGEYTMSIPTLLDLADDQFLANHCYFFGGVSEQQTFEGKETWYQIDVRAADNLNSPDVHGTFYLDSATAQLRLMDLELTRLDRLPRGARTFVSLHASTRFTEIASGLSVIESICAITQPKVDPKASRRAASPQLSLLTELQQLSRYQFKVPPPDVAAAREYFTPVWRAGQARPLDALWCRPKG